jgi:iron complex transport system ATP-binding protein
LSCQLYQEEDFSVFIVVTAGVSNAVDASKSMKYSRQISPGTINTWVFVSGELTEEAFIQSIMTATEAKAKAMSDLEVKDRITGTIATGTSTDSILIAATQRGQKLEYAGTITPLGKVIGKGVYECTSKAIWKSRKRVRK